MLSHVATRVVGGPGTSGSAARLGRWVAGLPLLPRLPSALASGVCVMLAGTAWGQAWNPPFTQTGIHVQDTTTGHPLFVGFPQSWVNPNEPHPCVEHPSPQPFDSMCWRTLTILNSGNVFVNCDGPGGSQATLRFEVAFQGYPLNIDLFRSPPAPSYPPVALTARQSTLPMVSYDSGYVNRAVSLRERPTLEGTIDLLQGDMLLTEHDMELPVGGATFRLMRTYAEPSVQTTQHTCDSLFQSSAYGDTNPATEGLAWDWFGQGWVSGTNPILLLDAAPWGIGADGPQRTAYFILDAHRVIPFIRKVDTGNQPTYEAPAHIDAYLTYEDNGQWDGSTETWTQPPSLWYVWLDGGAQKIAVRTMQQGFRLGADDPSLDPVTDPGRPDDVPWYRYDNGTEWKTVSQHALPVWDSATSLPIVGRDGNGSGYPMWGIAYEFSDRAGNRSVVDYHRFDQQPCSEVEGFDEPGQQTPVASSGPGVPFVHPPPTSQPPAVDCDWCCQRGDMKGQVRSVKLYAAGESVASWTLIFVHRTFEPPMPHSPNGNQSRQRAVVAVHAYPQDISQATIESLGSLTIPWQQYEAELEIAVGMPPTPGFGTVITLADAAEAIERFMNIAAPIQLPTGATHVARYVYSDSGGVFHAPGVDLQARGWAKPEHAGFDTEACLGHINLRGSAPRLLMARRTTVQAAGSPGAPASQTGPVEAHSYRLYKYERSSTADLTQGGVPAGNFDSVRLKSVYGDAELDGIRRGMAQVQIPTTDWRRAHWPYACALFPNHARVPVPMHSRSGVEEQVYEPFELLAERWRAFWNWGGWPDPTGLAWNPSGPTTSSNGGSPVDPQPPTPPPTGPGWGGNSSGGTGSGPDWTLLDVGGDTDEFKEFGDSGDSPFAREMFLEYVNPQGDESAREFYAFDRLGTARYIDRRGTGMGRFYRVYRFIHQPVSLQERWPNVLDENRNIPGRTEDRGDGGFSHFWYTSMLFNRGFFHPPFGWRVQTAFFSDMSGEEAPEWGEDVWITVVDEHDHPKWLRWDQGIGTQAISAALAADPNTGWLPVTRRVVWSNAAGVVLRERTWKIRGGKTLIGGSGTTVTYVYEQDPPHRVIEKRHASWAAAELTDMSTGGGSTTEQDQHGLIEVYEYNDQQGQEKSKTIDALGLKSGVEGEVVWIRQWERDPQRPDFAATSVAYTEPKTGSVAWPIVPPTNGAVVTRTHIEASGGDEQVPGSKKLDWSLTTQPAITLSLAANAPQLHPFELVWNDSNGRPVWRVYGLSGSDAATSIGQGADDVVLFDYTQYDTMGRVTASVIDAVPEATATAPNPTAEPVASVVVPALPVFQSGPSALARKGPKYADGTPVPAGAWLTWTEHTWYGPSRVVHPDGRSEVRKFEMTDDILRTYEYLFLEAVYGDHFQELGIIEEMHGMLPASRKQVLWQATSQNAAGNEPHEVLAAIKMWAGSGGQTEGLTIEGQDGQSFEVPIDLHRFGQVERERRPSGLITRRVLDDAGRNVRSYRGTMDLDTYWNSAPPNGSSLDDMVLFEKNYFGPDAPIEDEPARYGAVGALVEARTYREKPTNQYEVSTSENDIGFAVVARHDRRGRGVIRSWYESGPTPRSSPGISSWPAALKHEYTWLDQDDRVRFVAAYDATPAANGGLPSVGAGLDPRDAGLESAVPTAESILGGSIQPRSLVESIYDSRGRVTEVRTYDPADTSGQTYTNEITLTDHQGRVVLTRTSGGLMELSTYNARGELVESATLAQQASGPDLMLTSTRFTLDGNGNAIETRTRVRRHDAPNPPDTLDPTNSIETISFAWFDGKAREIARVDLGTNQATYSNASNALIRENQPPIKFDTSGNVTPANAFPVGTAATWPAGWTTQAIVTASFYDTHDRLAARLLPDGSITRSYHDSFGREVVRVENAGAASAEAMRITAWHYDQENGHLTKMAAVLPGHLPMPPPLSHDPLFEVDWDATDGTLRVTSLEFEPCVDIDGPGASALGAHGEWPSAIHYPQANGQPSPQPGLTFTYDTQGSLLLRTDARGATLLHSYSPMGSLARIDASVPPDAIGQPATQPADLVRAVLLQVDDVTGRLLDGATYSNASISSASMVARSVFTYDALGRLIKDDQSRGDWTLFGSMPISYAWESSPGHSRNYSRLASLGLPGISGATALTLNYSYGQPGSATEARSLVTSLAASSIGELARYDYLGDGRHVGTVFGYEPGTPSTSAAIQSPLATPQGYGSLDTHGRRADLHYTAGTSPFGTLHRALLLRDAIGSVTSARVTDSAGTNVRSWHYLYDNLQRVVGADIGELAAAPPLAVNPTAAVPHPTRYTVTLDTLGNWTGVAGTPPAAPQPPGLLVENPTLHAQTGSRSVSHAVDAGNALEAVTTVVSTGQPTTVAIVSDAHGNVVDDGTYFYQYDAWNRLAGVRLRGNLTYNDNGSIAGGEPGNAVAEFSYDALGRLVRTQRPLPPQQGASNPWRSIHHFHDGPRRVVDVISDPFERYAPVSSSEEEQSGPTRWVDRYYIHHPGMPYVGSVDDHLAIIDHQWRVGYLLSDHAGNPAAYVNDAGQAVERYVWSPFGQLLAKVRASGSVGASLGEHSVGFQGLHTQLLGSTAITPNLQVTNASAQPATIVHNRNRTYSPALGRFLQPDPLASGQTVADGVPAADTITSIHTSRFDLVAHYTDGMNPFAAHGGNPIAQRDASGLYTGYIGMFMGTSVQQDIYFDYNAEVISHGESMIGTIGGALEDYGFEQMAMFQSILDWSTPDDFFRPVVDSWEGESTQAQWQMSSRTGRIITGQVRRAGMEWHHLIPRFLGGWGKKGGVVAIKSPLHKEYHRTLDHALRSSGYAHMRSGLWKQGKRLDGRRLDASDARVIKSILMQVTSRFDATHGTTLSKHLRQEFRVQGWR